MSNYVHSTLGELIMTFGKKSKIVTFAQNTPLYIILEAKNCTEYKKRLYYDSTSCTNTFITMDLTNIVKGIESKEIFTKIISKENIESEKISNNFHKLALIE